MSEHQPIPAFDLNSSHSKLLLSNLGYELPSYVSTDEINKKMRQLLKGELQKYLAPDSKKDTLSVTAEGVQFFFTMDPNSRAAQQHIKRFREVDTASGKQHFLRVKDRLNFSNEEAVAGIQTAVLDYVRQQLKQNIPREDAVYLLQNDGYFPEPQPRGAENKEKRSEADRREILREWLKRELNDAPLRCETLVVQIRFLLEVAPFFAEKMREYQPEDFENRWAGGKSFDDTTIYELYEANYNELIHSINFARDYLYFIATKYEQLKTDITEEEQQWIAELQSVVLS